MELVEIARFGSRLEAETIAHALDQHDIPYLVQSDDIGIYGPGHAGPTAGGASIQVPASAVERVRELLSCVVRPLDPDHEQA